MIKTRAVAVFLSVVLIMSFAVSCKSKEIVLDNTVVRAEDPWYETTRFNIGYSFSSEEIGEDSYVFYNDDKVYVTNLAYDFETYERKAVFRIFDDEGNKVSELNIFAEDHLQIDSFYSIVPGKDGTSADVIIDVFGLGSGFEVCTAKMNFITGAVTDIVPLKGPDGSKLAGDYAVKEIIPCGQYGVAVIPTGSDCELYILKDNECICKMDNSNIAGINRIEQCAYDKKTKKIVVSAYLFDSSDITTFEIDPDKGTVSNIESVRSGETDDQSITEYSHTPSGELVKVDILGNITKYDIKKNKPVKFIENTWYSPYFSDYRSKTDVLSCSDDKVVLSTGYYDNTDLFSSMEYTITILKKAKTNPHAGKKVIEISAPLDGCFSNYLSDAVFDFNRTDGEYLIRIWSKYNTGVRSGRGSGLLLDEESEKLYTLIQELKGSEAPDIVIGLQRTTAMNDDILLDISGFLDEDVRSRQYSNIIDASKINGKTYFLPVTIEVEGLEVRTSDIETGAVGIDFTDFDKYVKEDLSGYSPYDFPDSEYNNKESFFLSCFDISSYIGDDVDFDSDQFRFAMEYAAENFSEDRFTGLEPMDENKNIPEGRYVKLNSYYDFIHSAKGSGDSLTIIGTPSVDAKGPRFNITESISVAAGTDMEDGCRKFINYLFNGSFASDNDGYFDVICTNREIMEKEVPLMAEHNNYSYEKSIDSELVSMSTLDFFGYKMTTDQMSEAFLDCLSSLSNYNYADPDIVMILNEEMAPYYAGDRSADDVIRYINDRVEKYISESR